MSSRQYAPPSRGVLVKSMYALTVAVCMRTSHCPVCVGGHLRCLHSSCMPAGSCCSAG